MTSLQKFLIFTGFLFIIFGFYLLNIRYNPSKLQFKKITAEKVEASNIKPTAIEIPSIGVSNQIYSAKVIDGNWEVSKKGISYLENTPAPGEYGNSVLYGHNFKNILGDLPKIKPGDKIQITMSDGSLKIFTVKYTSIVNPTDTYILSSSKDERITLYTCTGFLDSKRFVATALLVK